MEHINNQMDKICNYFRQISLRKRFIYVFSTTTIVTILASIILIQVQLLSISSDIKTKLQAMHQQDINISTQNNLEALLISYEVIINSYVNKVRQLTDSYYYFMNNTGDYTSNQGTNSPPNCSTFAQNNKNYSQSCIYFYNGNQIYPQTSFFDVLLPTLLLYNQQYVQRINVIYYNNQTNNITTVRTFPSAPISLNNLSVIQSIFHNGQIGYVNMSSFYQDIFTTNNNTIVSLSTVVPTQQQNISLLLQVEMNYAAITVLYKNILYFPGSIIVYCWLNTTNNNLVVLSSSVNYATPDVIKINAESVVLRNDLQIVINDVSYYASSIKFSQTFPINVSQMISAIKNPNGTYYMIQLVPSAQINKPYTSMEVYLRKQNFIIGASFGFTSLIALFTVVSFSFMASNGISSRLSKIAGSLEKYLKGVPQNAVVIKLKKLAAQNLIKKLAQNIISLIQKIENNKSQFANTTQTYRHQYPQNDFDIDFLRRINSKSADLWPTIQAKLMNKYPSNTERYQQEQRTRRNN